MSKERKSLVGSELGQYKLDAVLGEGGMATVYRAHQKSMDRQVAVKVLPTELMHDDTFMERFRREAKTVAQLEHFHILPVYDYGESDGMPYIVMRYLDGGTVADLLKEGPLPWMQLVTIAKQIAQGLDYAHQKGIIHRDIKPKNILLDNVGNAYLADFGIAKVQEGTAALTGSKLIGTPAYMAPEQAEGAKPTPQVDIYALGCLIYEMISGEVPYKAKNSIAQAFAHVTEPIPSLHKKFPTVPEAVSDVVKKAMAKKSSRRYRSATELVKDLEGAGRSAGWGSRTPEDRTKTRILDRNARDTTAPTSADDKGKHSQDIGSVLAAWPRAIAKDTIIATSIFLALLIAGVVISARRNRVNTIADTADSPSAGETGEEGTPNNAAGGTGEGAAQGDEIFQDATAEAARAAASMIERGAIIYETSFTSGWQPLTTERARSYGMAEGYQIDVGLDWAFWAFSNLVNEEDMYVEAHAAPLECQGQQTSYGLVFHYRDANHFRRYVITCANQYAVIDRNLPENEAAETLMEGSLPENLTAAHSEHILGVRSEETDFTVYFDGQEIDSGTLPDVGSRGDVGPYVETGAFEFSVIYTYLAVYAAE